MSLVVLFGLLIAEIRTLSCTNIWQFIAILLLAWSRLVYDKRWQRTMTPWPFSSIYTKTTTSSLAGIEIDCSRLTLCSACINTTRRWSISQFYTTTSASGRNGLLDEKAKSFIMSNASAALAIIAFVCLWKIYPLLAAVRLTQFTASTATDGSALCAVSATLETIPTRSLVKCSSACVDHLGCTHFNFRQDSVANCELSVDLQSSYSAVKNCKNFRLVRNWYFLKSSNLRWQQIR